MTGLEKIGRRMAAFHGEVTAVDPAWAARLAQAGLEPAADWSRLAPGEPASVSAITNCFKVELDGGERVFFKRYVYPRPSLRYFLRPSRGAVEVFGLRELARLGIPAARVVGFREVRWFGLLHSAYVITRGIPAAVDLRRYARETWWGLPKAERARVYGEIRRAVFAQLQRAHRADFFHHDLHWRNILIVPDGEGLQPIWIDCPRAAYQPRRRRHGELVDLSCLARGALSFLTPGQRLRALREYLGPERVGETRALYRAIAAHHRRSRHPPRVERPAPRGTGAR